MDQDAAARFDHPDDEAASRLFERLNAYFEPDAIKSSVRSFERVSQTEADDLANLFQCLDGLERLAQLANPRGPAPLERPEGLSAIGRRQILGPYDLLEEIGRGGMGIVYRARHRTLSIDVALKVIRSSELASPDEVRRFHQEARAAAGLIHPGITRVHDAGECDGLHFLTMDLIDGPSLAVRLRTEQLSVEAAAELMEQVARAAHYLHERGIVHRDIKPSNILLNRQGRAFVSDFGLAKVFPAPEDATVSGTIIGTPDYMSPEQAEGHVSQVTRRSDIFSLGAILYELLTGRPPFRGDSPLDTLFNVLEGEPILPRKLERTVPLDLERICLRCLEKDPQRRYATAAAFADDLQRFLEGEPLALPLADLRHRIRQSLRREPTLASHWLALGLAAAIVQVRATFTDVDPESHGLVMGVFAIWAVLCWGLQQWLRTERFADAARYLWSAIDVIFYTLLLHISVGWNWPVDILLVGYSVLITGAALWFRVRLIWFMTALSVVSYFVLRLQHPDMHGSAPGHYPFIAAAMLTSVGANVSYQVHRFKRLDRIYQRRALGTSGTG